MALTSTTLAVAIDANAQAFTATSATGATVGGFARINNEFMLISAISGTKISVKHRGVHGTKAVAHAILSPLTFGIATDFTAPSAGEAAAPHFSARDVESIGADGAVTPPTSKDKVVFITKASACAITLADPSALADGVTITFVSTTAAAHTVTLTTGYLGSSASDVLTFAAAVGHTVTLMAYKGLWAQIATSNQADESAGVAVA